ncbi:MAG: hypothetical protein LBR85_06640 [Oscillospiraceae bacterium]|jgi:parvulin-like peptidyl-prolyl isomerase|nr:hypothetical protein [Oscillospiraceae bacterium]
MNIKQRLRLIGVLGLFLCIASSCAQNKNTNATTLAIVNGQPILDAQIDLVYEDFKDSGITREKIIEDTILEILVVQEAPSYGIVLTESDIDQLVNGFKEQYPTHYKEAIDRYGYDALKHKLTIRNLFIQTKSYIINNILFPEEEISHELIVDFTSAYGLTKQFEAYTDAQIIAHIKNEIIEYAFRQWMNDLRVNADIELF